MIQYMLRMNLKEKMQVIFWTLKSTEIIKVDFFSEKKICFFKQFYIELPFFIKVFLSVYNDLKIRVIKIKIE